MQKKAMSNPKISFIWDSEVTNVLGDKRVTGLELRNVNDGSTKKVPADGLFIAIGHEPSTILFRGQLDTDPHGYVIVNDHTKTNIDGVFAAGDVKDARYRQAVTAAGSGCEAALDLERYLEEHYHEHLLPPELENPAVPS
jgi:thioredoxin reductase (NADPH)